MRTKQYFIITMAVVAALFSAGCNSKVFQAYMDKSDGKGIFLPGDVISPDTSSPDLSTVTAIAHDTIRVVFNDNSQRLDRTTAEDIANYTIQGPALDIVVTDARLVDPLVVELTVETSPGMIHGVIYNMVVVNVQDNHDNAINPAKIMPFYGRGAVVAELSDTPANPTNIQDIDITVNDTDDIESYQYRLDGGSWSEEIELATDDTITVTGLGETPSPHVLEVIGKDSLGNWQSTSAPTTFSWVIDITAPTAVLLNTPDDPTNVVTTDITVSGAGVAAYKYRLDSGDAWGSISESTGSIAETVANGTHTLEVIARDAAGNWQTAPTEFTWTVDTTQKFAELSQLPANPTSDTGTDIIVGGDGVVEYAYRIDGGAWEGGAGYPTTGIPVSDHIVETGLTDGSHTIEVIGLDDAGNWTDEAQATDYTWTVDTVAPTAVIATNPVNPSNDLTPSFTIQSDDLEADDTVAYFRYRLYRNAVLVSNWGSLNTQVSTLTLDLTLEGTYQIDFVGLDAAYNEQDRATPTSYTWVVDTTAPTASMSGTPADPTNVQTTDITVGGAGVTAYSYRHYNGTTWSGWSAQTPIATHIQLSGLTAGSHTIEVIGRDAAGNWQETGDATDVTWLIDLTAPTATLTGTPPDPTNSQSIDVTVGGTDVVSYRYQLDGGGWSAEVTDLGTHIMEGGLLAGDHMLEVIGKDEAGNWQSVAPDVQSPTTYEWTIDLSVPTAELSGLPANPTNVQTTDITVGGTDVVAYSYRYYNGTSWSSWSADTLIATHIQLSGLTEATYTIEVIGRDAAMNWQDTGSATTHSWTVDITAPTATISGTPAAGSTVTSTGTDFTIAGTGVTHYQYKLDGGSWNASTPVATHIQITVSEAPHTIYVIGRDAAGNWQATGSATTRSWTVDQTAPTPPAVSVTAGFETTTTGNLSYYWTNTTDFAEVRVQLVAVDEYGTETIVYGGTDGASLGAPSPATGTQTWTRTVSASDGWQFKARVRMRDAAGNWSGWGTVSSGITLVGNISGICMSSLGSALDGVALSLYRISNSALVTTASSSGGGNFTFSNVPVGDTAYRLTAVLTDYRNGAKTNISSQLGVTLSCGIVYLVPTTATAGHITGRTVDANTGNDISGATVIVKDWDENTVRTLNADPTFSTSDSGGATLDPGVYSLVISYPNYFTLTFDNIIVNGNNGDNNTRYALCQEIAEPQLRVIVQWGPDPDDLDLHVVGPTATKDPADGDPDYRFHVYYDRYSWLESSGTYDNNDPDPNGDFSTTSLVQDNTDYYGPESINLFGTNGGYSNGVYTFSVHNYTDRGYSSSVPRWYIYPVTMRIFDKDGLVRQISVPTGAAAGQDCWKAIKITMTRSPYSRSLAEEGTFFNNTSTGDKAQFNW